MRSLNDHPEVDKTVTVYYNYEREGVTQHGNYRGRWTGAEWQMRDPYSRDGFGQVPENIKLIGWDEM